MASVESLSDGELRHKLAEYGFPVGPVTETSRKVLIKKLKHLMVQAGRSSDVSTTDKWRRSSSQFSSGEEESENEDTKSRLNSSMPPPSSDFRSLRRKSTSKTQYPVSPTPGRLGRRKEINLRSDLFDSPKTSTPESEPNKIKRSRYSAPPAPQSSSGARRSPSRSASSNVFKDGFDTGSDSDIDSQKWKSNASRPSSSDSHDNLPYTSSFVSRLSSVRPKQKSGDSGGESSSVNTLLGFRKSYQSTSNTASSPDSWYTSRTTSTPFQSNFVKRLSGLSTSTSPGAGSSPSSIFDVKENDEVTVSPNGLFSPSRMSNQSTRSDIAREFKTAEDEGRFGCNSQLVSMILVIIVALFFCCLAVMYVTVRSRDGVTFALEDKANNFPICPSYMDPIDAPLKPDELCVEKVEIIPAIQMAKVLHPQIYERAVAHQCAGTQTSVMTHHEAIKFLVKKDKPETLQYLENYLRALKVLLMSNPHWGILVIDTATGATSEDKIHHKRLIDSGALVVPDPILPVFCYLKLRILGLLPLTLIFGLGLAVMFGVKGYVQSYVRRKERDKLDLFNLIEQVIDVLVRHQKDSPYGRPVFVPVNHVRDELINLADRERLTVLWERAVKYIREYESRIRCEMQTVEGELCEVWRWIPLAVTKSPPMRPVLGRSSISLPSARKNNKIWQGQAFDTMSGSPNSLPCSPTPCLKIRHMFEPDVEFAEDWPVRIEDAVLEKCGEQGVRALHISVDRTNREGCVYLKCASQEDAGRAYQALHGWWFDSHLVTVKYLRLERYHERFPEAAGATVPLCPSNNEKLSLQWQGSLEVN